jgi:hypothetical protein
MTLAGARLSSSREEPAVLDHPQPGDPQSDADFMSCRRLFRDYPLAVRRHYAEFRYGSMVLASRGREGGEQPRFTVLIMERDDLFVIRPWDRRDWPRAQIRRGQPVAAGLARLIESSAPVPRDGTLLGWLDGGQVRAILVAYGRLPEPWDDPSAVPGIAVLPPASADPARWPPLSGGAPRDGALEEGRLWEHAARGQLADLVMLIGRPAGLAFWVPGALGSDRNCIVILERLGNDGCWLLAGVYADHGALRAGVQVPPARQLLAMPGVIDLAWGAPLPLAGVRPLPGLSFGCQRRAGGHLSFPAAASFAVASNCSSCSRVTAPPDIDTIRPTGADPMSERMSTPSASWVSAAPRDSCAANASPAIGPATGSAMTSASVESSVSGIRGASPSTSMLASSRRSRLDAPTLTW